MLFVVLGLVAALVVGVAVVVVLVVRGTGDSAKVSADARQPKAKHRGHALVLGDGDVTVELYADYICPACQAFDSVSGYTLVKAVEKNEITLLVTPLAMLDARSTSKYSTRAAAAAVCAADGGRFLEYHQTLMSHMPAENSKGLSDSELVSLGSDDGLGSAFEKCVTEHRYDTWVTEGTDKASGKGVTSVPDIRIDGDKVAEWRTFDDALDRAIKD